jgi:glutamate formiminotransferase/formiminotetrahydrofolate cyclodeaminase
LEKQHRSVGLPDKELIRIAVKSLGLGELAPFVPEERVVEYLLEAKASKGRGKTLITSSLEAFADQYG